MKKLIFIAVLAISILFTMGIIRLSQAGATERYECVQKECAICGAMVSVREKVYDDAWGVISAGIFSEWTICIPEAKEMEYTKSILLCSECRAAYWDDLVKSLDSKFTEWLDLRQAATAKLREKHARDNHRKRIDDLEAQIKALQKTIEMEKRK